MVAIKLIHEIQRRNKNGMPASLDNAAGPAVHQIGDCAHLDEVAGSFEYVHQSRAIERRLHRVLPFDRKIEPPFVDSQLDASVEPELAQQLLHLPIETLKNSGRAIRFSGSFPASRRP